MNIPMRYCDCPEPVATEEQFCHDCGTEYQVTKTVFSDRLSAGERIGPYLVSERRRMWALLEDTDGQRFRFWPTGDTSARDGVQVLESGELDTASLTTLSGDTPDTPLPTPVPETATGHTEPTADLPTLKSEFREETVSFPARDTTAASLTEASCSSTESATDTDPESCPHEVFPDALQTANPSENPVVELNNPPTESAVATESGSRHEKPPEGELPIKVASVDQSAESADQSEVHPSSDPILPATRNPDRSSTTEPDRIIHLRHFTFLPATPVVLDGIPGYLEPERPAKFTGTEVLSLRTLLEADPGGEDRHPTRLLSWLVQCAQAMKSAHDQGILVNSFTPDTVFIDYDPTATRAERIAISTALYAAPFGEGGRVAGYSPQGNEPLTPRTDVYQLGALLRDLIGWQSDQVCTEEPNALLGQPMHLVRLLLHLMHPDPARRPSGEALKKLLVETQQAFTSQHVLDVAGITDAGLNREHNEDAFGFLQYEEHAGRGHLSTTILVVCDGVGGANAGEEASRMAVHEVLASLASSASAEQSVQQRLEGALLQANARLLTLSAAHKGAGCTIVAVYIRGQEYWVAHAGDSRAYVCINGVLRSLTADHSWTAQQVRKGLLTAEEASRHENAHVIYRSLGERDRLEIEVQPATGTGFPLEAGSVFLLCTDGVTDVLDDEHLRDILASNRRSPRDKARLCVQAANAAGGPDNVTALVAVQEINS